MAIFYPEMYCGIGSTLQVKKTFEIEFENGTIRKYLLNEMCIVEDIIGYGYNLKEVNDSRVFRILNGDMVDYFELIKLVPFVEKIPENFDSFSLVTFKKNFKIDGVVNISVNEVFKHEISMTNKTFHNLYSIKSKRLVLRMRNDEFEEYIK